MFDPLDRSLADLFSRVAHDPWFPVDAIPKRYLPNPEPTPAPSIEVEVTEKKDSGSTLMMGELLLPKQQRRELPAAPTPAAITASKEN